MVISPVLCVFSFYIPYEIPSFTFKANSRKLTTFAGWWWFSRQQVHDEAIVVAGVVSRCAWLIPLYILSIKENVHVMSRRITSEMSNTITEGISFSWLIIVWGKVIYQYLLLEINKNLRVSFSFRFIFHINFHMLSLYGKLRPPTLYIIVDLNN